MADIPPDPSAPRNQKFPFQAPGAASPQAAADAWQQQGEPAAEPRVLYEEVHDPKEKRKSLLLVGGICLVLFVFVGFLAFNFMKVFRGGSGKTEKVGLTGLAMYGETQQRMRLLSVVAERFNARNNGYPAVAADYVEEGADPNLMRDKWGTPFRVEPGKLSCAGQDRKFSTDDDMWIDLASGELGGFTPNAEKVMNANPGMPSQAKAVFSQMQRIDKIAGDAEQGMSEEINEPLRVRQKLTDDTEPPADEPAEHGPKLEDIDVTTHRGKESE